jgi:hypothetical protein
VDGEEVPIGKDAAEAIRQALVAQKMLEEDGRLGATSRRSTRDMGGGEGRGAYLLIGRLAAAILQTARPSDSPAAIQRVLDRGHNGRAFAHRPGHSSQIPDCMAGHVRLEVRRETGKE